MIGEKREVRMALGPKEEAQRRQREARAKGGDLQTVDRAGRPKVVRARTASPSADAALKGALVNQAAALAKAGIPAASKQGEKINTASDDPLMSPVLIAFTQGQKRWLDAEAASRKCRRSQVVRDVIAEAMK